MREKNKKLLLQNSAKMLVAVLLATGLAGCTDAVKAAETTAETTDISALVASATAGQAGKYDDEDSDATWDAASATAIVWSGASASVSGGGATASGGTVTISAAGTYVLSGTGTGQVVISAGKEDLVRLVLNGLSLTNETGAPVYVEQAEKAVVILADGTTNTLADGKTYTLAEGEDEPDAALFSKADLSITGSGALTVNANYKNGIASKDDLIITDGTITVTAANDGLRGKDSVSILDGILVVNAQGDGIQSNNDAETDKGWVALDGGTFTITAGNDGVQAETDLTVTGGTYDVTTGGGAAAAETHQDDQPGGMGGGNMPQMPTGTEGEMPSPPSGTDGSMPQRPSGMNPQQQADAAAAGTAADSASDAASTGTDAAAEETASDSYKAFKAGAMLAVTAGTFTIDAQDDAVHSNGDAVVKGGTFTISTGDDAIHAENALVVSDGVIRIDACYEGLEGATIDILGGDIRLTASDDGLNAAGGESTEQMGAPGAGSADSNYYIRISGGFVLVNADGDGIDANGSLYFDGGTVLVNGPTSDGNAAFDYDSECTVTGGTLIAVGSSGMAQTPGEDSTQAVLSVTYSEAQAAGTLVSLTDSSGKTIVSFTPAKQYKNIVISTPDLAKGNSYTLYSGGADSGYVAGGTVTGATKKTAVSLSDIITSISDDGTAVTTGGRGFGGNGGGSGSGGNPGNGGMGPGRGGRSGGAQNGQQSASTAATAG